MSSKDTTNLVLSSHQNLTNSVFRWPAIFDRRSDLRFTWTKIDSSNSQPVLELWTDASLSDETAEFSQSLKYHELRTYPAGDLLFEFDSDSEELFLILSGTYARAFARRDVVEGRLVFEPMVQVLTAGSLLTPAASRNRGVIKGTDEEVFEMCVCLEPGQVVRMINPMEVVRSATVWRKVACDRARDLAWFQSRMSASTEERVESVIKSMILVKELERRGKWLGFRQPIAQIALAEYLGIPDNTLRPYLKNNRFTWQGTLLLNPVFVKEVKEKHGLEFNINQLEDSVRPPLEVAEDKTG